jgi:SSS family transporter
MPLANAAALHVDGTVYLIGGNDGNRTHNSLYSWGVGNKQWERLDNFPGPPRAYHSAVVQETSNSRKIFVIGGRDQSPQNPTDLLASYVPFDLKEQKWDAVEPILIGGKPRVVMAASAEDKGSMHLLVYGGANGKLYSEIEGLELAIKGERDASTKEKLIRDHAKILEDHPGFSKEILAYNTITKKWFVHDTVAQSFPVTTLSFKTPKGFYIVSGEMSPGVRTPGAIRLEQEGKQQDFGTINYMVLAFYLLLSLLIGVYFAKKQRSTDDYFLGGGRIPWWASGLSVFGTLLSALTFMAIPAKAFLTDWAYFFLNITAILIAPVIAFVFIPFFNKLRMETAYGFLERRFNYFARALGSLSFILFQFGRIGIVLLLPSLAISIVTGIPVETSILIMGVLCIAYTTFGGMEAVIWTDVLQVIVLLGGSIVAIFCLLTQSDTSFSEAYTMAMDHNKINIINMDLNLIDATFWVVFLGGLASALISQGTDQTVVQRYLTSSNVRDAQKTLYTNAILTLPATFIFFGIGTLLFVYYSKLPERLSIDLSNNDSIFPWYIVNQLPTGVSGLLIAAIFSAAMSSISSSLNSVSTAFCNDFYKHYRPGIPDRKLLKIARWATLITGILGVLLALWMANSNIKSLWDQFYKFLGLITGGLGGMFLLGIITKRANATGTLMGVFISAIFIWYLSSFTKVNFLMYSFFGLTSCFVFGYLFSLIFKTKKPKDVTA